MKNFQSVNDSSNPMQTSTDVTGIREVIKPQSPLECLRKAENLLEEGLGEYERAEEIEEEFEGRKRGCVACEKVFHSLVEVTNAILLSHDIEIPKSHDLRKEKLHLIARGNLARLYSQAHSDLHHSGYYNQRLGDIQKRTIEEVKRKIKEEAEKL